MSTPCYIGKYENNTFTYMTCEHDGNPDYMGEILPTWTAHINELLERDNLSVVRNYPIVRERYNSADVNIKTLPKEEFATTVRTKMEDFISKAFERLDSPVFFLKGKTWYFGYYNVRTRDSIIVPLKLAYEMINSTRDEDGYIHDFYGAKTTPPKKRAAPKKHIPVVRVNVRKMF